MKTTSDTQTSAESRKLTPQEVLADWQVRSVQERSSETSTRRHGLPDQAKWHEGKADTLDFCALQLEYVVFPHLTAVERERDALRKELDRRIQEGLASRHVYTAADAGNIIALQEERDRLRQALERIAMDECGRAVVVAIAREALGAKEDR